MDFKVEISFYKLKAMEQELKITHEKNSLLENICSEGVDKITLQQLIEAKQDIIDALKDSKTKIENDLIDANSTTEHLRHGTRQLQEKIEKLEAFINSRGLKTGSSYNIYKLIDHNQKLNQELQETKDNREYLIFCHFFSSEAYRNVIADLKSALAVQVSNVCDLDQEKQDLIEILADKNDVINCLKADLINSQNSKKAFNYVESIRANYERKLEEQHQTLTTDFNLLNRVIKEKSIDIEYLKAEKTQLETQLAATIARDISFTLSGDYQVTKISKGKSIFNQAEKENPEDYDTWQGQETDTWDDDIDDEPDPSIGW